MAVSSNVDSKPNESLAASVRKSGDPKPLTEEEFKSVVRRLIDDTDDFIEDDVSPMRERAWRYYNGETDLAAPPSGRSRVVMSELRDVVEGTMPSLMRIFTSGRNIVEFQGRGGEDVQMAKQSTSLCNYTYWCENEGWQITIDTLKSGLVARSAAAKAYWTEETVTEEGEYSGLSELGLRALLMGEGVEPIEITEYSDTVTTAEGEYEERTFDCTIKRTTVEGRVKICGIPPEEFVIDRRATDHTDALLIGQRTEMRVTDLVAMNLPGVSYEDIVSLAQEAVTDEELEGERQARTRYVEEEDYEDAQDQTKYVPTWDICVRVDQDGDGIAEWRHVIACGEPVEILYNEPTDHCMFVAGSPIRIPFTNIGRSQADLTMDLQDITTHIVRQTLDNITNVNNPRKEVVENQVNLTDLLDNRFNGVVRVRAPGMIRDLETPFVGDKSLPVLQYIAEKQEMRTGISKQTMGLDADALQSMTEVGVKGVLGIAQGKTELIARTYAELFFKPLFRLVQKLYCKHQDRPKTYRLLNKYVEVDPSEWHSDMDVEVKVGLGNGTEDENMASLLGIKASQEKILLEMGPMNPLVSLEQYSHTLQRLTELSGHVDTQTYFTDPEMVPQKLQEWMQAQQQQSQQAGQAEAAEAQAKMQLEQQKAMMQIELQREKQAAELELEREKVQAQLELEREKARMDFELKKMELEGEAYLSAIKLNEGAAGPGDTNLRSKAQ